MKNLAKSVLMSLVLVGFSVSAFANQTEVKSLPLYFYGKTEQSIMDQVKAALPSIKNGTNHDIMYSGLGDCGNARAGDLTIYKGYNNQNGEFVATFTGLLWVSLDCRVED